MNGSCRRFRRRICSSCYTCRVAGSGTIMLTFDFPWAFALLPLPLLVWWLLPPFRETTPALRVPFFEQVAKTLQLEPSAGAVVQKSNWIQKVLAPILWVLVV